MKDLLKNKGVKYLFFKKSCPDYLLIKMLETAKKEKDSDFKYYLEETILSLIKLKNIKPIILEKLYNYIDKDLTFFSIKGSMTETSILKNFASNPNTPKKILTKLYKLNSKAVKYALSNNPNLPIELIEKLSKDDWICRSNIAINKKTPIEILRRLKDDKSEEVKIMLALNPNTPKDVLIELSKSKNKAIIEALLLNPNTPKEVKLVINL